MATASTRKRFPAWARVTLSVIALGLAVWFVLVPQFADAAKTMQTIERASVPLLLLAVACELGSLVAYTALTATVFGRDHPPFASLLRLDLIDLGINHIVPGGAPLAAGVRVRLFRSIGVRGPTAMSVTTIEILIANLVLGAILGIGVAVSLGSLAGSTWLLTAGLLVIALVATAITGVWSLVFHTDGTVAAVGRVISHLHFIPA